MVAGSLDGLLSASWCALRGLLEAGGVDPGGTSAWPSLLEWDPLLHALIPGPLHVLLQRVLHEQLRLRSLNGNHLVLVDQQLPLCGIAHHLDSVSAHVPGRLLLVYGDCICVLQEDVLGRFADSLGFWREPQPRIGV